MAVEMTASFTERQKMSRYVCTSRVAPLSSVIVLTAVKKLRQVFGREPEALVRERIVGHEHERHGHEDDRPHGIRCERQTMCQRGAAVFGMDAAAHSSGSLSASESSSSSLLNEE